MSNEEVDPEVLERALHSFKPIVFSLSSATSENVNTDKILEGLKRDEAFQEILYTIDARPFVREFLSAKPQNGKSKGAAESKKGHIAAEAAKSPATSLREEYVKIALSRELGRMAAVQAKLDLFESLKAQYLEDGMSEDEAMKAAEEDMGEDEEDPDQDMTNIPQRSTLYLCVVGYPNNVEDILEAAAEKVPLDCLLNISSKVPLSGSASIESAEKPSDKTKKGNEQAKNAGKKGKSAEDEVSKYLIEQLIQRKAERTIEEYNAADEVLVYTYEFPCDELPPRTPDGPPVYRLTGSEKAGLLAISEALIQIEESLHLFREWKSHRTVVHVPKYCGLLDPDAPKPVLEEVAEEKNKRKRSPSSTSKKGLQLPLEAEPLPPVLTTEDLKSMADVAANKEKYDEAMLEHKLQMNSFSVDAFIDCCVAQVVESTTTLSDMEHRAEKAMQSSRNAVGRFADFIFHEIMGTVNYNTPKAIIETGCITEAVSPATSKVAETKTEQTREAQLTNAQTEERKQSDAEKFPETSEESTELSKEEKTKLTVPKGRLLGAEGLDVADCIDSETLAELVALGISETFPHLSSEIIQEEVRKTLFLGFAGLNSTYHKSDFGRFWFYKNMYGWRHFSRKWGESFVDVLSKGDGSFRTQQLIYSFEGPTTFPDFVAEQKFCEMEKSFFYPPPAESDDEEPEEEEEDEDEEDEEGNIIPRKKKEPEPFPFLDHVSIIQRAMRKRRVNEQIIHHLATPVTQETVNHGRGARCASEEVEWMFPCDGSVIEVERSIANTKQLSCFVSPPRGLEFGFMFCEHSSEDTFQKYVPSHIRCFVEHGRNIKVMTEVVADNTVAAETMAYEKAVEDAKLEAKIQLETLQNTKKSARGKDKAAALPSLAELEETCINAIPRPQTREKCPPSLQISALFNYGNTYVSFNEIEESLQVQTFSWRTSNVDLPIRVWRNNRMDSILLTTLSYLHAHSDGTVELFSPQSQGYRVILSSCGTYMTEKENQCLTVTRDGRCALRLTDSVVRLAPLKSSQNVDRSTKDLVTEREDGVQLVSHNDELKRVKYGCNVIVSWERNNCTWCISGVPLLNCNIQERTLGVECNEGILSFDLGNNAASLVCPGEEFRAVFDFLEYRLHVHPINATSLYTVDCAFGGLFGRVCTPNGESVYRVSPFGRCSEEKDGLLVLPKGYLTPEIQPLMRLPEVWSPSFVETLEDTDVIVERDALHLIEALELRDLPKCLVRDPVTNKAIERFYESRGASTLKSITESSSADCRVLCCVCVTNADHSLTLVFVEPPTAHLLAKSFLRNFNALYSCAFGVNDSQLMQEYFLAVNSKLATTSTKNKVLLPSTVDELFLSTSNNTEDALLWYWMVRCAELNELNINFFSSFLNNERLEKGYEDALAFLSSNLPLAQREEFLPIREISEPISVPGNRNRVDDTSGTTIKHQKKSIADTVFDSSVIEIKEQYNSERGGRLNYWNSFLKDLRPESQRRKITVHAVDLANAASKKPVETYRTIAKMYESTPLMATRSYRTITDTGKTASSRGHFPRLMVSPKVLDFGSIKTQRCYAAVVYLTNTSTVPCRYRIVVPKEFKSFVSVKYPRHFMAPGLTEGAEVRISGEQPPGDTEVSLLMTHEGGSESITIRWKTVQFEPDVSLSPAALCVGLTPEPYVPGTIRRFKRKDSDDINFEEEEKDSSGGDDQEVPF